MRLKTLAPVAAPITLIGAALSLAGCGKKEEAPVAVASTEAAPAMTEAAPSASPTSKWKDEKPTEIPMALRGRWGLVQGDCSGDPAAAKGLITVDATSIKFYESVARLGKVKDGDDDEIDATYAFSGEGQEWSLEVDLKLEDGGRLVRKDTGKEAAAGTLTYSRCS